MKNRINELDCRKVNLIVFLISFIFLLLYAGFRTENPLVCDAHYYGTIAAGIVDERGFRLEQYPQTFRGVLFPIYMQLLNVSFLGISFGWKITSSCMASALITVILPSIFLSEKNISNMRRIVGSLLVSIIFVYFWGDLLVFPLSELVAVFLLSVSVLGIKRLMQYGENNWLQILVSLLTGASIYALYNTRVVYLYGVVVLLLIGIVYTARKHGIIRSITIMLFIVIGAAIIMLPQCVVNKNREGVFSPRVYTENYNKECSNLQMQQVIWGLEYQRYETYLGSDNYSKPSVYFIDEVGQDILCKENISLETFTVKDWLRLVKKYPADMVAIYARHMVNVMTPLWNHIYILDMDASKCLVMSLSIIIWILFGTSIVINIINGEWNLKILLFTMVFAIPALMQALGAVETRFFLPMYILAYVYCAYYIGLRRFLKNKKEVFAFACIAISIFVLWQTIISNTLAHADERVLTLGLRDDVIEYVVEV